MPPENPETGDLEPSSPFVTGYRASGVLLHVSSLPSAYGIGDLGPVALAWIDRLHESGQSWWQALPLGPTGYGNSPYQPLSSFAGNELLFSPDGLIEDGLLRASDCQGVSFSPNAIDYDAVVSFKRGLIERAWTNFTARAQPDLRSAFEQYCEAQALWLEDYALFRALKVRFNGAYYLEWPVELIRREPAALAAARGELAGHMERVRFAQFLLLRQGRRIREHARAKGVYLLGDLPFFVSPDCSDVWANPELFLLDEQHRPRFVAGVPPDYFSASGQLWGNPVYNWDALRRTGYRWWLDRLGAWLTHVDFIRLDHFRAFAAAWHVPADASTAQTGEWVPGPGAALFEAATRELGALPFVAEDLGLITPDVDALRTSFGLPGMRVLQFAFDGSPGNPHLPDNYGHNTVAYTGTHDNPTTRAWFEGLPPSSRDVVWKYLNRPAGDSTEATRELIRLAWSSTAALAIAPLQDVLQLGSEAQMNVPGHAEGNWRWRCAEDLLNSSAFAWLREVTENSHRTPGR
jgi:4-alpha-glucanotransferase